MTIALTVFCVLCVGLLLYAEASGRKTLRAMSKTLASLSFVSIAIYGGAADTATGQWMLAGLVLCLIGDVLLLGKASALFLGGMGAFALGHGAFAVSFSAQGGGLDLPGLITAAAMAVLSAVVLAWLWPRMGALRWPVAGYMVIIAVMVVLGVSAGTNGTAPLVIAVGAVAFAVSDIAVARDQFVADTFLNKLWCLPLYYGAQLLFAHAA